MDTKYYAINLNNHTTLILKCGKHANDLVGVLDTSRAIAGYDGTTYNLRNYLSFYEVRTPDERQKRMALTLDRII